MDADRKDEGRYLNVLILGLFVGGIALAVGLTVALPIMRQAVGRTHVDPKVMGVVIRDTVASTLERGTPEEKIDVLESLNEVPPADASPLVPALSVATEDEDPRVRRAAEKALGRIATPVPATR